MEISLEGKVALVTGCGPNIGSGIALALARYGAKVAVNDVSDEASVQGYIGSVLERWGRIDILVNNAALLGGRGVLDETAEAFQRAVLVSAMGNFLNTK